MPAAATGLAPKICWTASTTVIDRGKVLLVRHRKLDSWLGPGGHIDPDELPHLAAIRECREESGLAVRIISAGPAHPSRLNNTGEGGFLPLPLTVSLFWVCQENYQLRQAKLTAGQTYQALAQWPKGCEQHLNLTYLAKLAAGSKQLQPSEREVTDIAWFSPAEVKKLLAKKLIFPDVYWEVQQAFQLLTPTKSQKNWSNS